jgi:UDP-N-acetylglucosamine 2-epimerase (non-hydrolysing)
VDDPDKLKRLVDVLAASAAKLPVVFPVHPRTRRRLQETKLLDALQKAQGILLTEPLGYNDFMSLVFNCRYALTDSGGIQEETTYLGIPCITLRDNTERPITVTQGTNELAKLETAEALIAKAVVGQWKKGRIPALWDGQTAGRVAASLRRHAR